MATLIQPHVVRDRLFSAHGVRMHSFCIVRPQHSGTQEEALHWLADAHIRAEETHHLNNGLPPIDPSFAALMPKLLRRYGCSPDKISARGCELNDHLHTSWEKMEVYRLAESSKGAGLSVRSQAFARGAQRALDVMFEGEFNAPDDLIHVTCTGYISPSAAQLLVADGVQQHVAIGVSAQPLVMSENNPANSERNPRAKTRANQTRSQFSCRNLGHGFTRIFMDLFLALSKRRRRNWGRSPKFSNKPISMSVARRR